MAAFPVLVRAYSGATGHTPSAPRSSAAKIHALPPVSSYAFADILRSADSEALQQAIDGIAEICAKNKMSLAEEYASHLPPVGEITSSSSVGARQQVLRPGMRRALTSVPEGSSGSSEGSKRSKQNASGVFRFSKQPEVKTGGTRQIRIGSMGRTVSVGGTTALAANIEWPVDSNNVGNATPEPRRSPRPRTSSEASASLQRLLGLNASNTPR